MSCFGCKCNICARNVNIGVQYFTPGEVEECCFNCDDCIDVSGGGRYTTAYSGLWKGECPDFLEAQKHVEMRARIAREKEKKKQLVARGNLKVLPGGEKKT